MNHYTLTTWDFVALLYLNRQAPNELNRQAPNELSGLCLCGVPISMRTAALLFARYDILCGCISAK